MNASEAKRIADEYVVEQAALLKTNVENATALVLKKIKEMASQGLYIIYFTPTLLYDLGFSKVDSYNLENDIIKGIIKSLENDYGYLCSKDKTSPSLFYTIKWS